MRLPVISIAADLESESDAAAHLKFLDYVIGVKYKDIADPFFHVI
jgi:hypothetical protein